MMFKARPNEPQYARLNDPTSQAANRYGKSIETVAEGDRRRGKSLNINGDGAIGENPNRYKQHGFFFNADNCIGCHACEAACSEKNNNPPHQAFRSVGFIEGGTFPNASRINISLACNHCDDPVCLKGCPTRAYTKFAEYGAVLQDPDICFGCGYCTWVCPYNAPQLDPVKGVVSKCNMCVDRLEVGLKPACASACLGKALDFGVIENIPEGRTEAKIEIPGFPDPGITHPNVRFQQTRTLARDMVRVDSRPIKFHRKDASGGYRPVVDPKHGFERHWNLRKLLGSHENAHIAFTLSTQAVAGAFLLLVLGAWLGPIRQLHAGGSWLVLLFTMLALSSFGMFKLNMHLGKPHRFYRGFYNLRYSPVSREIAGVSTFFGGFAGYAFLALFDHPVAVLLQKACAAGSLLGIAFGGFYMIKLYRIRARPFWNHWQTGSSFVGTALSLGASLPAIVAMATGHLTNELGGLLAGVATAGLALEGIGLAVHARDLRRQESEGAASHYEQTTTYGYSYLLRNGVLGFAVLLGLYIRLSGNAQWFLMALLAVAALVQAILGRALFFCLVIPTTMPGAFFWRNPGFVEHARKTGLADMPQMGVVHERHHPFRIDELVDTILHTSTKQKFAQFKRVFTG
jgi:DMSO reductase iron-sulfur subunit